jgi:GNAT superfamily N-acetyltransferase
MEFRIEEVRDIDAAWPEIEPLLRGIVEYHEPYDRRGLRSDWAERWRDYLRTKTDGLFLVGRWQNGPGVAFLNGRIVRDSGIFDEVVGYIDDAFVAPEYRSRGAGRALLRHFEAWSRDAGADLIRLEVVAANELGMTFWIGSGFEVERHTMRKALTKEKR